MKDKLILLPRNNPTVYEIHRYEINQDKNLILTTKDFEFADCLVTGYNWLVEDKDEWLDDLETKEA